MACRPRPFGRPAAIAATKSLDDTKLADYIHTHTFNTVMGDIKFGKDDEGAKPRMLEIQYHDIKPGACFKNSRAVT